jgi:preprotein translocase subunit YajC
MTSTLLLATLVQAKKTQGSPLSFQPIVLLLVVMYFLMLRPQRRARQQHSQLVQNLKQGDRVVALGGVYGTVRRVDDDSISLQVADNVVIKVEKASIQKVLQNK